MKTIKRVGKIGIFLCICLLILLIGIYFYAYFSPKLDLNNIGQMYIYDNKGDLIETGSSNSSWVSLDDINSNLINAFISVEDKHFYSHNGFDYLRIVSAMIENIKSGSLVQGASTISQQYVKNMYLDFDKTWERKIEEAFLTLQLEIQYDKDEILEGYLNTIYFGNGNYGVLSASMYYFNKDCSELSLEEAIMLAGIPKNPSKYNPVSSFTDAIDRADIVAKSMVNNNMLSVDEYNNLDFNSVSIYGSSDTDNLKMIMYYQDAVLDELETLDGIPTSLIESGSLKIYTTLDIDAQEKLESEILNTVTDSEMQVASVVIDPNTGGVLALTGGVNYLESQYNRATMSKRQVGSTMKPFLYYAALDNGLTSGSTFMSEESSFVFSNNQVYSPKNYNSLYANKNITMAAALAYSDNIYAVKTHLFLGESTLVKYAKLMGIEGELEENPSLALGTSEINMLDFARGYTTLASGGYLMDNYFITRVEDMSGNVLYEHTDSKKMVLNYNYVYILNEMMSNTSNKLFLSYTTPTALSISSKMSRKYALKTGTTSTDYWTVGYNSDALMLIWMGYDEGREVNSNASRWTKNIWVNVMEDYLSDKGDGWYETPSNVVSVLQDPVTGEAVSSGTAAVFYYVRGSQGDVTAVNGE